MCTCKHGSDRHYLDYAGPGVCGGILTRCLEEGCGCKLYVAAVPPLNSVQIIPGYQIVSGSQIIPGGQSLTSGRWLNP